MDEWIAVFKSGTHIDSSGKQHTISEKDLDVIAEKYNEQSEHEAPAVIGHPKDNGPAWGWVESLKRDGHVLYAKFKDMQAEFVELLQRRMFKKRSISLYPDMTLRHIGFLGAMPPAVKGLPDFAFEENDNFMEFEFTEKQPLKERMLNLFSNFLDSFVEHDEPEQEQQENQEPDEQTPADEIEKQETVDMSEELQKQIDDLTQKVADFQEQVKTANAERDQAIADRDALKDAAANQAKAEFEKANKDFVDGLDIMPKYKDALENVLNSLHSATAFEFGEEGEKPAVEVLRTIVSDLVNPENFSEVLDKKNATEQLDNPAAKLEAKTREIMDATEGMSYSDAFAKAQRDNPELAAEYAETYAG